MVTPGPGVAVVTGDGGAIVVGAETGDSVVTIGRNMVHLLT